MSNEGSYKSFFHLLQHILIAAVLFCAVGAVAIFLWYVTVQLEHWGVSEEIRTPLHYAATLLFWLDIFCLFVFVLAEVWKWLKEIFEGLRR